MNKEEKKRQKKIKWGKISDLIQFFFWWNSNFFLSVCMWTWVCERASKWRSMQAEHSCVWCACKNYICNFTQFLFTELVLLYWMIFLHPFFTVSWNSQKSHFFLLFFVTVEFDDISFWFPRSLIWLTKTQTHADTTLPFVIREYHSIRKCEFVIIFLVSFRFGFRLKMDDWNGDILSTHSIYTYNFTAGFATHSNNNEKKWTKINRNKF